LDRQNDVVSWSISKFEVAELGKHREKQKITPAL